MKYILLLVTILLFQLSFAQVSITKVVRVANATTTLSQPLSEGNILINLDTDKCYLILKPIAGTSSISSLTTNVDYKEISGTIYQTLDVAQLNGTKLELSLSDDGEATHQIELNSLSEGSGDSTFVRVTTDTLLVAENISYVDSAHGVKINNNLTIEADGTIRMDNEATVWDDLNVYPDAVKKKGINDPKDTQFKTTDGTPGGSTGVFLDAFDDDKDREVFFTVQLPHGYKEGTDLHPHVHWTPMAGTPTGTDVTWGLEYTVVSVGELFGNTTIITGSTVIGAISSFSGPGQHLIISLGVIDGSPSGSPLKISSVLVCRLFRDVGAGTFNEPVGLLGMDFHYEQDTQGSRVEFTK